MAILIYLNEQVEGLITDKKVGRDSRAEALLHYCCWTVTYMLLSAYCHTLLLYCATELFARTDAPGDELQRQAPLVSYPSISINTPLVLPTGTTRDTQKTTYSCVQPQMPGTCSPDIHSADGVYTHTPLASGQRVHLMTALPRPHKPLGTHMCTLTPTHL